MNILNKEELQLLAPSIFADRPYNAMSDRYRFVPTSEVVNAMQDSKFYPVMAKQSKTRIPGKGEFTRHIVRFRSIDNLMSAPGEEIPEIVLINSHDGTSTFKAMLGFFRIVCGNGLVVSSSMISEISTRHTGSISLQQQVIDAARNLSAGVPGVLGSISRWKEIKLEPNEQMEYASRAAQLRDSTLSIEPHNLLRARRWKDDKDTLWNVFNNVQENMIKGGMRGLSNNGRRIRTRAINSVTEDVRINRALWELTEEVAKQ